MVHEDSLFEYQIDKERSEISMSLLDTKEFLDSARAKSKEKGWKAVYIPYADAEAHSSQLGRTVVKTNAAFDGVKRYVDLQKRNYNMLNETAVSGGLITWRKKIDDFYHGRSTLDQFKAHLQFFKP